MIVFVGGSYPMQQNPSLVSMDGTSGTTGYALSNVTSGKSGST